MVSTRSSRKRKPSSKATTPKSSAKKQKKATPKSSKKATAKRKSAAKKKASPAPTAPLEAARSSYQRQSTLVAGLREEDFEGQDRGMQLRPHHRTDERYTGSSSSTKKSVAKKKATPKSKKKTPRAKTPVSSTRRTSSPAAAAVVASSSTATTKAAFNPVTWMALAIALALLLREGAVRSGAEGSTMFFTGPAILPEGTSVLGAAWLVFVGAVVATAMS